MFSSLLISVVFPSFAVALVAPKKEGFAIPISKRSHNELQARATASDPLTISSSSSLWYGSVNIGTPATAYNIDFDTGSTPFFVSLSNCTTCSAAHAYNPTSSTTNTNLYQAWSVGYVDSSSASGWTHTDTVSIGGLTAPNQLFGGADTSSSGFFTHRDGMMGLGWPSSSLPSPFIYTLYTLGLIDCRQFALKISTTAAELYIGGANPARYTGSIYWNPLIATNAWDISLASVQVGTSQVVSTASRALIDSGTTLIDGPAASVAAIFAKIPGAVADPNNAGGWTYPCASADPGITFTFNGKSWAFPIALLKWTTVPGDSTMCRSTIKGWSASYWILGDAWMKSVYVVYDFDTSKIGFAALA